MSVSHYQGIRCVGRCLVWYCEDGIHKPLPYPNVGRRRNYEGYEWSYSGAGPAKLAFALLAHRLGVELADLHFEDFMRDVIAPLPPCPSWTMPGEVIDQWFSDQDLVLGHPNITPNQPKGGNG